MLQEIQNFLCINVQTEISFTTLINLQKETDTESSIGINDEIVDEINISEEISLHQNPAEVIDHTCDDNVKKLLNTEEEVYPTPIDSINATNGISMKYDENLIHKYYAPF